jgi:hypothetical protein
MGKGNPDGYRWSEKEEKSNNGNGSKMYYMEDAAVRWKKCKTCKYATLEHLRATDGKKGYEMYCCNYILFEGKRRDSDPINCDKYEKGNGKRLSRLVLPYGRQEVKNV